MRMTCQPNLGSVRGLLNLPDLTVTVEQILDARNGGLSVGERKRNKQRGG